MPAAILISFDGFRAAYLDDQPVAALPNFHALAARGARGELVSAFETKTFPNHWSLATGQFEETHGIVGNNMFDPVFNSTFSMANKELRWWGGEPIWKTVERQGKRAATFFWPGSEVHGLMATDWMPYNGSVPFELRVDTVLQWLSKTADAPALVTLYFEEPDHSGHLYGPYGEETRAAVRRADAPAVSRS